jgi:CheY-like chemotaxis protein
MNTEAPGSTESFDLEGANKELLQENIDEALDQTRTLDSVLDDITAGRKFSGDLVFAISGLTGLLTRISATEGYQALGIIAHRLDDYFKALKDLSPKVMTDLRKFVEILEDLLDSPESIPSDASAIVRSLPAKGGFDGEDIEVRSIEVMLVMLPGTATRYVERELHQCGYRVSHVTNVFDALPTIVRTKPDLVVISGVMQELNGIDLAIGLSAMPATRNVPIALITALGDDDGYLNLLPKNVPIIRKGASFADDLFKALDDMFLI